MDRINPPLWNTRVKNTRENHRKTNRKTMTNRDKRTKGAYWQINVIPAVWNVWSTALISDGSSECDAHVWSQLSSLISVRHLITSTQTAHRIGIYLSLAVRNGFWSIIIYHLVFESIKQFDQFKAFAYIDAGLELEIIQVLARAQRFLIYHYIPTTWVWSILWGMAQQEYRQ